MDSLSLKDLVGVFFKYCATLFSVDVKIVKLLQAGQQGLGLAGGQSGRHSAADPEQVAHEAEPVHQQDTGEYHRG